ncbi:DNA-directed RNA polymerase sigma-70 factor [Bacteroidota bacterium]|nr:DNA-directed RNA polymerase sigma-70 factor [Bacteroidota bacterium]
MEKIHSINQLDDKALLLQYRNTADKQVIAVLYQRYMHLVLGVCMKYLKNRDEAEDATMQVFEKLLIQLQQYEVNEFKFWIHTVSKNHCLYILRKQQSQFRNQKEMNKDFPVIMENEQSSPLDSENWKNAKLEEMNGALMQLKEGQKICVELFYLEEKSYQEIVDQTGYSMLEVKSFIQNGKRNLKIMLSQNNE